MITVPKTDTSRWCGSGMIDAPWGGCTMTDVGGEARALLPSNPTALSTPGHGREPTQARRSCLPYMFRAQSERLRGLRQSPKVSPGAV